MGSDQSKESEQGVYHLPTISQDVVVIETKSRLESVYVVAAKESSPLLKFTRLVKRANVHAHNFIREYTDIVERKIDNIQFEKYPNRTDEDGDGDSDEFENIQSDYSAVAMEEGHNNGKSEMTTIELESPTTVTNDIWYKIEIPKSITHTYEIFKSLLRLDIFLLYKIKSWNSNEESKKMTVPEVHDWCSKNFNDIFDTARQHSLLLDKTKEVLLMIKDRNSGIPDEIRAEVECLYDKMLQSEQQIFKIVHSSPT